MKIGHYSFAMPLWCRSRRFQTVFPYKIRLRADWIAVILALSARLPARITGATEARRKWAG